MLVPMEVRRYNYVYRHTEFILFLPKRTCVPDFTPGWETTFGQWLCKRDAVGSY